MSASSLPYKDKIASPRRVVKLESLELGRGVAAFAVVMHHASQASTSFTASTRGPGFEWGALGVDFFFVLSGFIIYHVHHRDERTFAAAKLFVAKRLRRIYTPYLPIALVLILAYVLLPELSKGNRNWGWFTSLTLLPSSAPPALSVAWTLVYEMVFYAFFLIFYATRHFWYFVAAWVVMVGFIAVWGNIEAISIPILATLANPLILEFVAGMAVAHVFSRMGSSTEFLGVLAIAAGGALAMAIWVAYGSHRVFFGLSLAPLVLACAMAESRFGLRLPRPLLLVGAASYSIYLIHNPLQSLVARAFVWADSWLLTFVACCVAAVVAGLAYHLAYERPALRILARGAWKPLLPLGKKRFT